MQHYTTTRPDKPIRTQESSHEIPTRPSHPLLVQSIRLVSQICPHTQLPMPSPSRVEPFAPYLSLTSTDSPPLDKSSCPHRFSDPLIKSVRDSVHSHDLRGEVGVKSSAVPGD
ncbi:hypothetical protein PAXRUDRAFT_22569 [Paxillus rubicundulus Ve08.2h10]|uniref:Uncharacterized protein n=1 Tax=Paxillus rubicundulus Ve08.2h10 TaxID=930991 RepID=A0A0D0BJY9_9AGAM|nr:hypothetical protein PAXRUDRAFT_22569 [Paxillus rubicundulus Ve08.2h10]